MVTLPKYRAVRCASKSAGSRRLSGREGEEIVEAQAVALAMYLGAQPVEQRLQLAAPDRGVESVDLAPGGGHELGGAHGAERVAGEIAE